MAKKKSEGRLGWHLIGADLKTKRDLQDVSVGVKLTMQHNDTVAPQTCSYGMHASDNISQALKYSAGPVLCRVLVEGDIASDYDKFCGRHRTVIWMKEFDKKALVRILKAIGAEFSHDMDRDQLAQRLKDRRTYNGVDAALEAWARDNGWTSDEVKKVKAPPKAVEYHKDEKIVKALLSKTVVRSMRSLCKDFGIRSDSPKVDELQATVEAISGVHLIAHYDESAPTWNLQRGYVLGL